MSTYRALPVVLLMFAIACGPSARQDTVIDSAPGHDGLAIDASTIPDIDAPPLGPVDVMMTADNAYSFGYGDSNGLQTFIQGSRATTAGEIFNCPVGVGPEHYTVPAASAPQGAYLYVIAWDDLEVTQGVLGQFTRDGATIYTGDAKFQVCATGLDYSGTATTCSGCDPTNGPTEAVINTQIGICNAASGAAATTSQGWVDGNGAVAAITPNAVGALAVGEDNTDAGGTFPITCETTSTMPGVDGAAHWMWYDPKDGMSGDAFHATGVNRFKAFLIFRLPADDIVIERGF